MTDEPRTEVERLSEILARQAESNENRVIGLIREALMQHDVWAADTLERIESRQVVSSWAVRSLLVYAFRAGAKYEREKPS